jgi:uncharacterized protein (TIGR03437 family)
MRLVRAILFLLTGVCLWAQPQPILPQVLATPGDPNPVLYGVYNGSLIVSPDRGRTWTPMYVTEPGLPQPPALAFAIDALDHDVLYLATTQAAGTFWRSADRGATWRRAVNGLPSGPGIDFFKQILDGTAIYLYAKVGQLLFLSTNRGESWTQQGNLPGADGVMDFAPLVRARGYFIDRTTLQAYNTIDEGHSWNTVGRVTQGPDVAVNAAAIPYADSERLYVSVSGLGQSAGVYVSSDAGQTFFENSFTGLGNFSRLFSGPVGPLYAPVLGGTGFFRSTNDGVSWTQVGTNPVNHYSLHAVDPVNRNILYALRGGNLNAFVRSTDAGNSWDPIEAVLTPTLAKPVPGIDVTLLEGAPYQHAFTVQTLENAAWATSVTLSTSGEPWLELTARTGTTPLSSAVRINTAGLAPGTYQAVVRVDAPGTFNRSVSFPVVVHVRAFGSVERRHVISTVAGSGAAGDVRVQGPAMELGIGAARAVAFDPEGRLWISAGNRLWQAAGTALAARAGNGTKASTGDGLDALEASISDPEAIAFDPQNLPHFTEYDPGRVRRISNNSVNTRVSFLAFNFTTGSHGLLIDEFGQVILAAPEGVLRYDGVRLRVATPFAFRDPYGLARDAAGNLYVSDRALHQIFRVPPQGPVTLFAGRGPAAFGGDGGPALEAFFNSPGGLALGPDGTLYVADTGNQRVRAIGPDGVVRTIAGSGLTGFAGDGGIADFASFQNPISVAVGPDGRIYVADSGNNRVRVLELRDVQPPPPPPPNPQRVERGGAAGSPLAPGGLFSIYGTRLANTTAQVGVIPWPTELGGVRVTINGVPAPLIYVSPTQVNGQVPYETAPGTATLVITVGGTSGQAAFQVAPASPGILIYGDNRAVAVNPNGSVNGPNAPVRPGEVVVMYLSGLGTTNPPVPTGAPAPASPLAQVNYTYSITVGGRAAEAFYLGQTPGFPSLAQANFRVPALAPGDYPVVVTVNGVASNAVLLAVGP